MTYDHCDREARVERNYTFQVLDMLGAEYDLKCLEIGLEMLHFAASNDREHIRRFLHDIGNRDRSDVLCTDFFSDLVQRPANGPFCFVSLPLGTENRAALLARLEALFFFLVTAELSAS